MKIQKSISCRLTGYLMTITAWPSLRQEEKEQDLNPRYGNQVAQHPARYGNPVSADRQPCLVESGGKRQRCRSMRREAVVEQLGDPATQPTSNAAFSGSGARRLHVNAGTATVAVPLLSLRPADSPRLNGEDKAHIARLAETETPLPPILVDKRTMRVIDGMHRLMAASLQGRETIDVIFFDGDETDIFLRAVEENVAHGLPLSQTDRRAAAERIIASHPHMSDRAIGHSVGLSAKTIAAIRKRSSEGVPQSNARVGRDGRIRPLDSGIGRRRAAELLADQPNASLRDVARAAGISPATVLDVRKRLERGESPVPGKLAAHAGKADAATARTTAGSEVADHGAVTHEDDGNAIPASPPPLRFKPRSAAQSVVPSDPAATVEKLLRDPSLRNNERGKGMLRLLHINAVGAEQLPDVAEAVPPHCVGIVVQLAHHYAKMWQDFAKELDGRARIIDPSVAARRTATQ
jgi:ParB-like chromosome segregation protein Spo0J